MWFWSYHPEQFLEGYYQGKSGRVSIHHQRRNAQSCGRRFSKYYPTNAPTLVTKDMKAHLFVCATSRYTYRSTGYVAKKYLGDSDWLWFAIFRCTVTTLPVQQVKHKEGREYPDRWIVKRVSKISWPNECFIRKHRRATRFGSWLKYMVDCLPLSLPINPNIERN